jgi:hypothetical protein
VEVRPAWRSRHSHEARIFLSDGNIVTFAQGSREFCEQCKAEMEAMLEQRRTFYWHCRKEDEQDERTLHERSMAHPNQRLLPEQPGM